MVTEFVYVYETYNSSVQFFFVCIPVKVFSISLNATTQNKFVYNHYSHHLINKAETKPNQSKYKRTLDVSMQDIMIPKRNCRKQFFLRTISRVPRNQWEYFYDSLGFTSDHK